MEDNQIAFVLGTLLLGGVLAFLGYYLASRKRRQLVAAKRRSETASKNVTDAEEKKPNEQREVSGPPGGGTSNSSSKRQAKSKKRREAQQEFSHSWMVGALKGHTAPVLDMDFSANGKFLASCAEDCGPKEDASAEPTSPAAVAAAAAAVSPGSSSGSSKPASGRSTAANRSSSASSSASSSSSDGGGSESGEKAAAAPSSPSSSSTSSAKEEHQRAILSRRQRKNRTRAPRELRKELRDRDEDHEDDHNGPPPAKPAKTKPEEEHKSADKEQKKTEQQQKNAEQKLLASPDKKPKPIQPFISMPGQLHQLTDAALALLLRRYTLTGDQLAHLGYPVELSHFPGYTIIVNYQQHPMSMRSYHRHHHHHHHHHGRQHHLDVNAREFVPGNWSAGIEVVELDSGNGSASSSLESSDLEQESASDSDKSSDVGEAAHPHHHHREQQQPQEPLQHRLVDAIERRCARCYRPFYVGREDGEYVHEEKCYYHWGKLRSGPDGAGEAWECCRGREAARGCSQARGHVWTGLVPGYNGPYHDYARTRPARQPPPDGNYGVYALDCEMCFTKRGLELGKVTVVGLDGSLVYEALCKPDFEIIDYNTRFSGLRAKDIARATKNLRDIQKDITSFVSAETILIGHGLENDLRALKILHPTVVDTCVAFPHFLGYPYRSSLKTLARTVLRKEIQVKEHDSAEDARIAVDLMLKRLQHDFF